MIKALKPEPILWVLWAFLLSGVAFAQAPSDEHAHSMAVTISNVEPRRDVNGNILDVHDGALEFFGGRFYLYGTHYGDTDGLGSLNRYVCYSSRDLLQWEFEGLLLKDAPRRIYYRPYVEFNRSTGKYVLWYNADNRYGVAISDRPAGPFTIYNPNVAVKYSEQGVGDFGLFVDTDGTAYISYTALNLTRIEQSATPDPQHHRISVERLSPDYLSSTQRNSGFVAGNIESPSMFKRDGVYYLLFDNTCAFCTNGSGVRVYTATDPLGPYAYRGNINLKDPQLDGPPWTIPGTGRKDTILDAQQTHVARIPTFSGALFMWMGDRWGSTPDDIKGHDFQVWVPLAFGDDGMIRPLKRLDRWPITLIVPSQLSQDLGERRVNGR